MKFIKAGVLCLLLAAPAVAQHNPSYSGMGNALQQDAYLRPDLLAGIRFQPDSPAKRKAQDAVINGTRYPLNDPDIKWGVWATPIQQWNKAEQRWDFRGLKHIIDSAIAGGKRYIYLRPVHFAAAFHIHSIPEHFKSVTAVHNGHTFTTVDIMDDPTFARLKGYYTAFNEQIVRPYHKWIIGIDATWAGSIDGGQTAYVAHLPGGDLTSVFGFSKAKLLEEIQFQYDLWGGGMICHISPNTIDHWVTEFYSNLGCNARRHDSRPFRETRFTNQKADLFGWEVLLDIYEITGGHLGAWTKQSGRWYGGEGLERFYGTDYPGNVERAFTDVKREKGFIWPMASFPSKQQEPQYWTHYLEGPDGALNYVPGQIRAFYDSWHDGTE